MKKGINNVMPGVKIPEQHIVFGRIMLTTSAYTYQTLEARYWHPVRNPDIADITDITHFGLVDKLVSVV